MLTVQSNLSPRYQASFQSRNGYSTNNSLGLTEEQFEEKARIYKQYKEDFEDIANSQDTPKSAKKVINGFKIIATALFEGWMVAWGASKGIKFLKSTVLNGSVLNKARKVFAPIGKGLTETSSNIGEALGGIGSKIKTSSVYTKIASVAEKMTNKLNQNKFGKKIVSGLKYIGKAIKTINQRIGKLFNKVGKDIKNINGETVFDKTTKATATTLGVGSGIVSAYNETFHPEQNFIDKTDEIDDEYRYKMEDED